MSDKGEMSLFHQIRTAVLSIPLYIAIRRWQREGFLRAYSRNHLWRQILATRAIRTAPRSPTAVEVHTLCYRLDYLPAIWALKTFYKTSGVDFPLVIHVNGTSEKKVFTHLQTHFPDATLIPQEEADRVVGRRLSVSGFHRLAMARRASPFMLKLTDFPMIAEGATIIGIDSDVLFFARPDALVEMALCPGRKYLFQRDLKSVYNTTFESAMALFGIQLAPSVNTGIMVYSADLPDMASFDRYLADPSISVPNGYIEQTLYALHASEIGSVNYLPNTYLLDLRPDLSWDGIVARHYAGPSRMLLTYEGMPRVLATGLLS